MNRFDFTAKPFGNQKLTKAMIEKFGTFEVIKVKPNYMLKVQKFCADIEKAHKATDKSTLRF